MEINIENAINKAVEEQMRNFDAATLQEDQVLTAQETAEFIGHGISYATLMRECRKGNMPCFRIGTRVYFRKSRLLQWIKEQEEKGGA